MIDIYFEAAPDGGDEPTLWHSVDPAGEPQAILRRCDIGGTDGDYHWRKIVAAMEAAS